MVKPIFLLFVLFTVATGCVNFNYRGESSTPSANEAVVFTDATKIGKSYRVLGEATASGDYRDVSRDRLLNKLKKEAAAKGADAILITEQQVVPQSESRSVEPRFNTAYDYDSDSSNWRQIQQDVDVNYGNACGSLEEVSVNARYIRILRAEFLKYTNAAPAPEDVAPETP
ncbi:MAG: hypothetical protein LBM70_09575 [Victivallales bacterium]|jgi:hypothetical protein|nr:hypothetical protein [Victivallales bacterium]